MSDNSMESQRPFTILESKIFKTIRNAMLMFFQLRPARRFTALQDLKHKFFRSESLISTEDCILRNKVKESLIDAYVSDYNLKAKITPDVASSTLLSVIRASFATISTLSEENSKDYKERSINCMPYSSKARADKYLEPAIVIGYQMQVSQMNDNKSLSDPWKELKQSLKYQDDENAWGMPTSSKKDCKAFATNFDVHRKGMVSEVLVTPENGYFPKALSFLLSTVCTKSITTVMSCVSHVDDEKINMKNYSEPGTGTMMPEGNLLKNKDLQYCSISNIYHETVMCKTTTVEHGTSNCSKWNNEIKIETFLPVKQQSDVVIPKCVKSEEYSKLFRVKEIMVHDAQPCASLKESIGSDMENLTYERCVLEIPQEITTHERHPTRIFAGENVGEYLIKDKGQGESVSSKDPLELETTEEAEKASIKRRAGVNRLIRWLRKKTRRIDRIFICCRDAADN